MPLLEVESNKLSNNQLVSGVIDEIIESDDLFRLLPFSRINGKTLTYNREKSTVPATFLSPVVDTVTEGGTDFDEIVAQLRVIAGDVDMDNFLLETQSDSNDQKAIQIAYKAKSVGRVFSQTLMSGDRTVNAKAFDGVNVMLAGLPDQTIAAGGALSIDMLDELADKVALGADAIFMRPGTIRAYKALLRLTAGGTDAHMMQLANFGKPVLTHHGIPILRNDFIPEVTGTCSIIAARLNEVDGLHGLWGGNEAGIRYEDVGTVQNKDSKRSRLKWYTSLALRSTKSIAAVTGVTNL